MSRGVIRVFDCDFVVYINNIFLYIVHEIRKNEC